MDGGLIKEKQQLRPKHYKKVKNIEAKLEWFQVIYIDWDIGM